MVVVRGSGAGVVGLVGGLSLGVSIMGVGDSCGGVAADFWISATCCRILDGGVAEIGAVNFAVAGLCGCCGRASAAILL